MKFAIDLDGTITTEEIGHSQDHYKNRTPRPYMVAKIRELYNAGHTIIIHSSRYPEDFEVTTAWLIKNHVMYHQLILGKVSADVYVDARNIKPETLLMTF
jgi:uncharacterized HAD superfamily protein